MRELGANAFLIVAGIVFFLGILGVILNRRNLIIIFMSIELMLLGVNLNFIIFSSFLKDMGGQIFSLFILTVAAAEAAIGLAILVTYFRQRRSILIDDLSDIETEHHQIQPLTS